MIKLILVGGCSVKVVYILFCYCSAFAPRLWFVLVVKLTSHAVNLLETLKVVCAQLVLCGVNMLRKICNRLLPQCWHRKKIIKMIITSKSSAETVFDAKQKYSLLSACFYLTVVFVVDLQPDVEVYL